MRAVEPFGGRLTGIDPPAGLGLEAEVVFHPLPDTDGHEPT